MLDRFQLGGVYIDGFMIIVAAIILIAVLMEPGRKEIRNRILILICILNLVASIVDMLCYLFEYDMSVYWAYSIVMSVVYIINICTIVVISLYQHVILTEKNYISETPLYIITFICGMCCIFWVFDCFGAGFFWYVNEFGELVYKDYYIAEYTLPCLAFVYDLLVAISCSKSMSRREIFSWVMVSVTPGLYFAMLFLAPQLDYVMPEMVIITLILFIGIHAKKTDELIEKEAEIASDDIRIKLSQMNPELMREYLSSINERIDSDPDKAKEAISVFSGYLRAHVNALKSDDLIFFNQELATIRAFLQLELISKNNQFEIAGEIFTTNFKIPPLSVLSIIENIIENAESQPMKMGTLSLSTRLSERGRQIAIEYTCTEILPVSFYENYNKELMDEIVQQLEDSVNATVDVIKTGSHGALVRITIPYQEGEKLVEGRVVS